MTRKTYYTATIAASALAVSLFAGPVQAQVQAQTGSQALQPAEADEVDTIIVTGARFETPIDQIGRSVSVITAEEIEVRQQRFLYEALQASPGVQPIRSGSFGAVSSVSIRGLPSGQTLVVQDGVVLNNPSAFGNTFNFANFDTSDIERIEVLRGAQSTLYGAGAIGGVVNIVTKSGGEGYGGSAFVEGGSFGTFRGAATARGGSERASGRVTVSGVRTDGFSTADEANGNTEDDGFENITVSTRGELQATDNLSFETVLRYQNSEADFDGFDFDDNIPSDADNVSNAEEISLAAIARLTSFDGLLENRLLLGYSRTDQENTEADVVSFDANGDRLSIEYQGTVTPTDKAAFIYGVEYETQESVVTVGFGASAVIETISGYGLLQLRPTEWATLNVGVRHDSNEGLEGVNQTDDTTLSGSGAIEIPGTGVILRGSYNEGFRAPSAGELGQNADLQSEISKGWDIGLARRFFDNRVELQATYFDQQIDNLIGFDPVDFRPVNIEEFDSSGVEVGLSAALLDNLDVRAAYTYVDALNVTTKLAAGLQPSHRVNVELDYRPTARLRLSANVLYNGEEELGGEIVDDFTLLNLRAAYDVSRGLELFARVENATDADYQDNPGFGTAPVSAFGGVRARF